MKKLLTLGLAAGLVMAASAPASAVDVKFDGLYTIQYDWAHSFVKKSGSNDFQWQYLRVGATFAVSESLSGYFQMQARWQWGNNTDRSGAGNGGPNSYTGFSGGNNPGNFSNLAMRMAYIDWLIPGTVVKVRMGRQSLAPAAVATGKNPAFWQSDPVDGIAISAPINDMFNVNAFWARYGRNRTFQTANARTADLFYAGLGVKLDGFRFDPWFAFAAVDDGWTDTLGWHDGYQPGNGLRGGNQVMAGNGDSNIYWLGITGQMTLFDPLTVKASFVYGDRNFRGGAPAQHGWFVDGVVSYKTAYGTPSLAGWYASGDKKRADYQYQGNLPSLAGRNAFSMGFFNGGKFQDNIRQTVGGNHHAAGGTWGLRLAMDNISFLQDLSHDIALVYASGTNDGRGNADAQPWFYMTKKDHIFEIDFTTQYKIYKNLSALFGVAYIIEDFQTRKNGSYAARNNSYTNGWGISAQLTYAF